MALPKVPKSLHRLQLERLKHHIESDAKLTGLFHTITTKPTIAPINNAAFFPTLAIYIVRENFGFATTESHARPALFTMALLYPEAECTTKAQITPEDIYLSLVDVVHLLVEKLWAIRADPRDPGENMRSLWHCLMPGGSRPSKEATMQLPAFSVGYEREDGVKQVAFLSFALYGNLDNQENEYDD